MRSLPQAIALLFLAVPFATCSNPYMGIRECQRGDCLTLRRGITKEQFLGHRAGPVDHSESTYRVGDDVWEVWVFTRSVQSNFPDQPTTYLDHEEYVAFKNGVLDEWGWGTLPRALRKLPLNPPSQNLTGS